MESVDSIKTKAMELANVAVTLAELKGDTREKRNALREKKEVFVPDPMWPKDAAVDEDGVVEKDAEVVEATKIAVLPKNVETHPTVGNDWQALSRSLGLELFERQPEETDEEWRCWDAYRRAYPSKLPTMSQLSKQVGVSVATLVRMSERWSWKVRMMHWSRATDADIQDERRVAIKEMNQKQLGLAQSMFDKLQEAVDYMDPATMKPSEITNMFKVVTGLQKDIATYTEEVVDQPALDGHAVKQAQVTKKEDLSSVAEILASVGLLDGATLGVRTTEVVIKKDKEDDNNG